MSLLCCILFACGSQCCKKTLEQCLWLPLPAYPFISDKHSNLARAQSCFHHIEVTELTQFFTVSRFIPSVQKRDAVRRMSERSWKAGGHANTRHLVPETFRQQVTTTELWLHVTATFSYADIKLCTVVRQLNHCNVKSELLQIHIVKLQFIVFSWSENDRTNRCPLRRDLRPGFSYEKNRMPLLACV